MKIFQLHKSQFVPASIEQAWSFFSNPNNLEKITPPDLSLRVKGTTPDKVYSGMIIEYTVAPLFSFKSSWLTEIKNVVEGKMFIDEQRVGPYKLWYHQHLFHEIEGEVEIEDIVHYALPCGPFSSLVNETIIKNKLDKIFFYRRKVINDLFANTSKKGTYNV